MALFSGWECSLAPSWVKGQPAVLLYEVTPISVHWLHPSILWSSIHSPMSPSSTKVVCVFVMIARDVERDHSLRDCWLLSIFEYHFVLTCTAVYRRVCMCVCLCAVSGWGVWAGLYLSVCEGDCVMVSDVWMICGACPTHIRGETTRYDDDI